MNDVPEFSDSSIRVATSVELAGGDLAAVARSVRRRRKSPAKPPLLKAAEPLCSASNPLATTAVGGLRLLDPRRVGRRLRQQLEQAWRWLLARRASQIAGRRLNLCESVSLGEKRFLALVQVDGQRFLVGGAAGSVSLLAQLEAAGEFTGILRKVRSQKRSNA